MMMMAYFAGFDSSVFPGPAAMLWLSDNSAFHWCGYYLAPAPNFNPDNTSWRGQRAALAARWGLAPVYVGQQEQRVNHGFSSILTAEQGAADARQAASNARTEGFPDGTCIYLDWEDGSGLGAQAKSYLSAWAAELVEEKFHPGFYCSHLLAAEFEPLAPAARLWCWKVPGSGGHAMDGPLPAVTQLDPSGCGVPAAYAWQYQQNAILSEAARQGYALTVDMSTALSADPGAPSPAQPGAAV
jgi:hypothetical protein